MIEKDWKVTDLIRWAKASGNNSESVIDDYVMLIDEEEIDGHLWAFTQQEWEKYKPIDKRVPKLELLSAQTETSDITWAYNLKTKKWDYMKNYPPEGIVIIACEKIGN
ncbi:hypothetical protein ACE1CI_37395 [Aerosakkonemataceae cyanobacterium BLCC-F50]|uniref:Phage protein n=1 Tax=Floridaenema flaviceps BLCC-F50 TaxID=3153642 RepID=A0ABV4Y694_9CYAN